MTTRKEDCYHPELVRIPTSEPEEIYYGCSACKSAFLLGMFFLPEKSKEVYPQ